MDPTLNTLIDMICAFGWLEPEDIELECTLIELQFDSTNKLDLVGDIERQFAIRLTDEQSDSASTVAQLYQLILSKF